MTTTSERVFELYSLHTTNERFYIVARRPDGEAADQRCLSFDRLSGETSLVSVRDVPQDADSRAIFGIIGIIRLIAGPYLMVITKRQLVGEINRQIIWRIHEFDIISFSRTTLHLNEAQVQDNKLFLGMVTSVLQMNNFYYSYTFDITHTLQRLQNTTPDFRQMSLLERADTRFMWNGFVTKELAMNSECQHYIVPIMFGFIGIRQCTVAGQRFQLALVSRRSCLRAGVRFHTRGVDAEGHVANFVESEQIVEYGSVMCSFVQTRGSIPLFWSQSPNLRWQPQPSIRSEHDHQVGFRTHIDFQMLIYGKQTIINLVNHKGREWRLGNTLENIVNSYNNPDIKYVSYDFHKECGKLWQWNERLPLFIDRLKPIIDEHMYFAAGIDGSVFSYQSGTCRTNCMDCLDRTNVVQSLIAHESLEHQLRWLKILTEDDRLSRYAEFEASFKAVWADNGDVCSIQYAGTGALKSDFTRTGHRTFRGGLSDLGNALHRYYLNNFVDGYKLDAMNLFLGNYTIDEAVLAANNPFRQEIDWTSLAFPIAAIFAFAVAVLTWTLSESWFAFLFWFFCFLMLIAMVIVRGEEYVNKPRLKLD